MFQIITAISEAVTESDPNARILAQLSAIDAKSIRALREGDTDRIADLERQAVALRSQLT